MLTDAVQALGEAGFDLVQPFDAVAAARDIRTGGAALFDHPDQPFDAAAAAREIRTGGAALLDRPDQPFDAAAAARESRAAGAALLDDPDRPLGLLVGNTRALWPRFVAARAADAAIAASPHPLELYTVETIERVARALPDARTLFAHRAYGGVFLPFQRLAVAAGIGTLAPTQLVIHPVYGPWFALRAIILCAGEPPAASPRAALACTCDARCHEAFATATAASGPERWRAWLAVRDACPVGRDHRYSDEQIAYHYSFMG